MIDIDLFWFSGTGAGGQHRNKKQNSVRLVHRATGITVTSQTRSRQSSLDSAISELESRLNKQRIENDLNYISQLSRSLAGSGCRGDKIRTYRYKENVVNDHKSNRSCRLTDVLKGNIDLLW